MLTLHCLLVSLFDSAVSLCLEKTKQFGLNLKNFVSCVHPPLSALIIKVLKCHLYGMFGLPD